MFLGPSDGWVEHTTLPVLGLIHIVKIAFIFSLLDNTELQHNQTLAFNHHMTQTMDASSVYFGVTRERRDLSFNPNLLICRQKCAVAKESY